MVSLQLLSVLVVLPGISGVRHGLGVGGDRDGTHEHTQCLDLFAWQKIPFSVVAW